MTNIGVADIIDEIIEEEPDPVVKTKVSEISPQEVKNKSRKFFSRFWTPIGRCCGSKYTEANVINYLDHNQKTLEDYIINRVSVKQLESWLDIKKEQIKSSDDIKTNLTQTVTSNDFFMNMETKFNQRIDELNIIHQLARYIKVAVAADTFRVFKIDPNDSNLVQFLVVDSPDLTPESLMLAPAEDDVVELVREVSIKKKILRLSREKDSPFPNTPTALLAIFDDENEKQANHVLYQPLVNGKKTTYVFEMWRIKDKYNNKDEEICANIVTAFQYLNMYFVEKKENIMTNVLLDVVKMIFKNIESLEQVYKSILQSAQVLVNAERTTLYIVDEDEDEDEVLLVSIFELNNQGQENKITITNKIPLSQGIPVYVASTGETISIVNAYSDHRFNREMDMATNYMTKSLLCMPIKIEEKVIGVVEMANKQNNFTFDHEDEAAFEKFSIFYALALRNTKQYNELKRNEYRFNVTLEMLSYHNTCNARDLQEIQNDNRALPVEFDSFYLDPYKLDHIEKCRAAVKMFDNLFDLSRFDSTAVFKFIVSVKKYYRTQVPYHNFDHAWTVAQTMYVILKNDENHFDYEMKLALFVACLCHDLDHRGYNNDYVTETNSPLAVMYYSSPLENHHYSITIKILQQDGHNIFSHFSNKVYKRIQKYIRMCILATDLSTFSSNLAKLKEKRYQSQRLNAISTNRNLIMALSMTAADLSASAKPWDIQMKTVDVIFEEFYAQGDIERNAGKTPLPMMDRTIPTAKPVSQVDFLVHICIPCYTMLYEIFPKTKLMLDMAKENLARWQSICVSKSNAIEMPHASDK